MCIPCHINISCFQLSVYGVSQPNMNRPRPYTVVSQPSIISRARPPTAARFCYTTDKLDSPDNFIHQVRVLYCDLFNNKVFILMYNQIRMISDRNVDEINQETSRWEQVHVHPVALAKVLTNRCLCRGLLHFKVIGVNFIGSSCRRWINLDKSCPSALWQRRCSDKLWPVVVPLYMQLNFVNFTVTSFYSHQSLHEPPTLQQEELI